MDISKEEAIKHAQSKEAQQLLEQHRKQAITNIPVLANLRDIIYKAYKRPYIGSPGTYVLIIIANGWYYPTPQVDLYIESSATHVYKLMQNNSSTGFGLLTYHTAQWTSGLGLLNTPNTITIEDAYGKHTINVESYS